MLAVTPLKPCMCLSNSPSIFLRRPSVHAICERCMLAKRYRHKRKTRFVFQPPIEANRRRSHESWLFLWFTRLVMFFIQLYSYNRSLHWWIDEDSAFHSSTIVNSFLFLATWRAQQGQRLHQPRPSKRTPGFQVILVSPTQLFATILFIVFSKIKL